MVVPVVSVIVPIYNMQNYLSRCLSSLQVQTFADIEILMINDGSTDGSAAIAQEYAERDKRFRYYAQENRGLSGARNTGLDYAFGKYIVFVDSDDYTAPDYVEMLVKAMKEADCELAVCNYYECTEQGIEPKNYAKGLLSRKDFLLDMAKHPIHNYYVVMWNKIYIRELIEQHSLRFDLKARCMEDIVFNTQYFLYAPKINMISGYGYYYLYDRKDSLSHSGGEAHVLADRAAWVYCVYKECWEKLGLYRRYRILVQFYGARLYFDECKRIGKEDRAYLYQKCLAENGFSKVDYLLFASLRAAKKLVKK